MKNDRPILQILADEDGVYEIGIRSLADEHCNAEQLSAAIKPAIDIIDQAIQVSARDRAWRAESKGKDKSTSEKEKLN